MGSGIEDLTLRDRDLVVNPLMVWVPNPGVAIFGPCVHAGRTGGVLEVLQAPRVRFTDRHGAKISAGAGSATGPTSTMQMYQRSSNTSAWMVKVAPASGHAEIGSQPDPRANAANESSVYL